MMRTAVLSEDKLYRYSLRRLWNDGPEVAWVLLNPSVADARTDDPTVRRLLSFSDAWGFGSLVVVNLWAYRATDPFELATVEDPVGPGNREAVEEAVYRAELVVCGWGDAVNAKPLASLRRIDVRGIIADYDRPAVCLGRAKSGAPKHPLYVHGRTEPQLYGPTGRGLRLPNGRTIGP